MADNPLPDFVSSLSKYHTVSDHFKILKSIEHDVPVSALMQKFHRDLVATARQRYLLVDSSNRVVRDKLVDLAQLDVEFTDRMRMVMYFLFMFRDRRYRNFICGAVGDERGKWNTSIFSSSNAGVREFEGEGGRKAFTNLRRFLIHAGILDEGYGVHFPELATWFPWAVEICSQYIENDAERQYFLNSPHGFLIKYRLNALLNATAEEISAIEFGGTYEEANDSLPTYESPSRSKLDISGLMAWDRLPPTSRDNPGLITSFTDSAVLERCNRQHYLLESAIQGLCSDIALRTETSQLIDLLALTDSEAVLFEMKSSGTKAVRPQIRRALSQVLEYRYLYREKLPPKVHLCIVIERKPRGLQAWLIDYLTNMGVGLIWKNDEDDSFNCSDWTMKDLGELLPFVREPNFKRRKR